MAVLTLGGGRGGGPLGKANAAAIATPATRNAVAITTNIFSSRDPVISLLWYLPWRRLELWLIIPHCQGL